MTRPAELKEKTHGSEEPAGSNFGGVLILGLPRSGTTALFCRVRNSLPFPVTECFEPPEGPPCVRNRDIVAKLLWSSGKEALIASYEHLSKKIWIARDPRDRMAGYLLYFGGYHKLYEKSWDEIDGRLALLEKKERDPAAVPLYALWQNLCGEDPGQLRERIEKIYSGVLEFTAASKGYFTLKYEDYVDDKVEALESYLGFRLTPDKQVRSCWKRVEGTKSYSHWRHWFTPEDVDFFRPLFSDYLARYEYDEDWRLASEPAIPASFGAAYVRRLIEEKRRKAKLPARS